MAVPNYEDAQRILEEAFAFALSEDELPQEWIERTKRVGQASNLTFVAALGTGLLARATDPAIDPLTLKVGTLPEDGYVSYSARNLAKVVLAPFAIKNDIHLGRRKREPLNNQPFFRSERISRDMPVHASTRPDLDFLVESMERIRDMPPEELLPALAAFLRERHDYAVHVLQPALVFEATEWTLDRLIAATVEFVTGDPEGGKRGQALVAAALDFLYPDVEVGGVNDPSRRYPGDVHSFNGEENRPVLAVEVKQVNLSEEEFYFWAQEVAGADVTRSMVVALARGQSPLDCTALTRELLKKYGVLVEVVVGAEEFLYTALTRSTVPLEVILAEFPEQMQARLEEMDVRPETTATWVGLFEVQT
jgi:hypothetical protein